MCRDGRMHQRVLPLILNESSMWHMHMKGIVAKQGISVILGYGIRILIYIYIDITIYIYYVHFESN